MKTMTLDIVSAEEALFNGCVRFLAVTGQSGELGIYPGHTALLTSLKPGQICATLKNEEAAVFYISGGMLEVQPNIVSVLADTAIRADNLDEAAAKAAKERAEKLLTEKKSGIDYSHALTELAEAAAQLQAITALRQRSKH